MFIDLVFLFDDGETLIVDIQLQMIAQPLDTSRLQRINGRRQNVANDKLTPAIANEHSTFT